MPSLSPPVFRMDAGIPADLRDALESAFRRPLEAFCRPAADALNQSWVLGDTAQIKVLSKVVVPDPWVAITDPSVDSWTAFSASFNAPAYRIHSTGQVETRGYVKSGTIGASGTAGRVWQIPTALRPALTSVLRTASNSAYGEAHAENTAAGGYLRAAVGNTASFSLDDLRWWPAAPAPYVASCWPVKFPCTLKARPKAVMLGEARELATDANVRAGYVDWEWALVGGIPFLTVRNVPDLQPGTYNLSLIVLGG